MSDGTKIEWTDATWNPITGCAIVSPGCTNCYAMKLAGTRLQHHPSRAGLTKDSKAGPVWTGEVRFNEQWLAQPLIWSRPRMIFVCAHGDLFAEGVPDEWIDKVFAIMALAPQHIFQVLTKRPERMRDYLKTPMRQYKISAAQLDLPEPVPSPGIWPHLPLQNVWLGVSVEDQKRADERLPTLHEIPAALLWVSNEPSLGAIDWKRWLPSGRRARSPQGHEFIAPEYFMTKCEHCGWIGSSELQRVSAIADTGDYDVTCCNCHQFTECEEIQRIGWMVGGGESGGGCRPMHPHWAYDLRDQCAISDTPFLFKQWGNWIVASAENGHHDSSMATNDAIWLDVDGRQAKPSCDGMREPIGMFRVTKSRAGRKLAGVEHNGYPPLPAHFTKEDAE
ncbi:phage Gp37/Gp68 family protein [Rhizobium lentis]|uniref:Protein gp37 n=1 Tax=Rhizobium lentis TaxID=1138194 RepID=A0A7W8XEI0_9HYPH|nr:phage Gp37/Gp68 family protein [Rhizobium lentis]MBB4574433.1 protein gp37 [Rhizobium lentis]MBB5550359.1 protein gp37 [Rhizobium lentis]MBB5560612.1 protein gp37 [Rhizobium lentis]MBB5567197.1 protein gp37 [Rhizobium lentis]